MVYREHLVAHEPYSITAEGSKALWTGPRPFKRRGVASLGTNKAINAQASRILYGESTWEFNVQHPIWPENFRQHIGPRNAHHIRRLYTVCDMWAKMLLLSQSYVDGIMYALGTDLNRVLMLAIGHPRSMHRDVSFHFYNRFRQLPDRFWIRWASRAEVKERLTLALLREPLVEPDLDHSMTAAEWLVYESPLRHETERVRVDRGHFELSAQLLLVHSHSFTVKSMLNAQLQNNTTRRQVWFTRTDVQATILGIQKPSHLPTPTRQ